MPRWPRAKSCSGRGRSARRRSLAEASHGRFEIRDPETKALRPSRAGDILVLAPAPDADAPPGGSPGSRRAALRRRGRQVVLRPPGGARDPDRPARARRSLRSRVAGGALRSSFFGVSDRDIVSYALSGGTLWLGNAELEKPGGEALGPALALLAELHRDRTRLSVPALLERLYDATRILAALTGTRRGESRISNLEKVVTLARQSVELGALTRPWVRAASRGADRDGARGARPAHDAAWRSGYGPRALDPQGQGPRGADRRALRFGRRAATEGRNDPAVERGPDRGRLSRGLPAAALGGTEGPRGGAGLGRGPAPAVRGLHARARLLVVPSPPGDARAGNFWKRPRGLSAEHERRRRPGCRCGSLPLPGSKERRSDLRALAAAAGGDAAAAGWEQRRRDTDRRGRRAELSSPISATRLVARRAAARRRRVGPTAGATSAASCIGCSSGSRSTRPSGRDSWQSALAPSFGVDASGPTGRREP